MSLKKLVRMVKPPCSKCPFTLGKIKFAANPCLECKRNDYATYNRLVGERHIGTKTIKSENPLG